MFLKLFFLSKLTPFKTTTIVLTLALHDRFCYTVIDHSEVARFELPCCRFRGETPSSRRYLPSSRSRASWSRTRGAILRRSTSSQTRRATRSTTSSRRERRWSAHVTLFRARHLVFVSWFLCCVLWRSSDRPVHVLRVKTIANWQLWISCPG